LFCISGEVAVNQQLSLSTFTIEIDRQPVLVLQAKWQREADGICQEWLQANLTLKSNGVPLCDAKSESRVRLAHPDERARYWEASETSRSPDDIGCVFGRIRRKPIRRLVELGLKAKGK
jgi:hypothetical protein